MHLGTYQRAIDRCLRPKYSGRAMKKLVILLLLLSGAAFAQDSASVYGADGGYRGSIQFHEGIHLQQPAQWSSIPLVAPHILQMQQANDPLTSYMRTAEFQQAARTQALQQQLIQQEIETTKLQNEQLRKQLAAKEAALHASQPMKTTSPLWSVAGLRDSCLANDRLEIANKKGATDAEIDPADLIPAGACT